MKRESILEKSKPKGSQRREKTDEKKKWKLKVARLIDFCLFTFVVHFVTKENFSTTAYLIVPLADLRTSEESGESPVIHRNETAVRHLEPGAKTPLSNILSCIFHMINFGTHIYSSRFHLLWFWGGQGGSAPVTMCMPPVNPPNPQMRMLLGSCIE